jgi:hypothetical protein
MTHLRDLLIGVLLASAISLTLAQGGMQAPGPVWASAYFVDQSDTLVVAATYTLLDAFDASSGRGVTWDASNDFVTVPAGTYLVSMQVSFNGGNTKAYDCALHKADTTEVNEVHFSRTMGSSAAIGSASAVGVITLSTSDTLRVKCLAGGGDNMVPRDGQLMILRIG